MSRIHTNFVLLGHPRCGSNLLARALAEHPQVRMAGELLSANQKTRIEAWQRVNARAWPKPRGNGYELGQDGAEFLRTRMFSDAPIENILAFGFKLFYDDAAFDPHVRTAWDYMLAQKIKVVHIVRRNLLYALISKEVAERTDRWFQMIEEGTTAKSALPPFVLDPSVCQRYFDDITHARERAARTFAQHEVLTIEYEQQLCLDYRATTFRMFDFLNVLQWYSKPGLVKQQALTAPEQITNFEALRKHFRDTPYSEFFESALTAESIQPAR